MRNKNIQRECKQLKNKRSTIPTPTQQCRARSENYCNSDDRTGKITVISHINLHALFSRYRALKF